MASSLDLLAGLDLSKPVAGADLLGKTPSDAPGAQGWRAGVAGLKSSAAGAKALGARALGAKVAEQEALQEVKSIQEAAAPDQRRVEDVSGFGDALDFAKYAVTTALPSILMMGAGGAVGRGVGAILARRAAAEGTKSLLKTAGMVSGAAVPSVTIGAGEIFPEAVEHGVEDPVARSVAGGLASGALDTALPGYIAARTGLLGAMRAVTPRKAGVGALVKGALEEGAKGAVIEGATEAAQEGIGRLAAGQDMTSTEAMSAYLNAAAIGAIAGKAVGTAGGAVSTAMRPIEQPAPVPSVGTNVSEVGTTPNILGESEPNAQDIDTPLPYLLTGQEEQPAQQGPTEREVVLGQRDTAQARLNEIATQLPTADRRTKVLLTREAKTMGDQVAALDARLAELPPLEFPPIYTPERAAPQVWRDLPGVNTGEAAAPNLETEQSPLPYLLTGQEEQPAAPASPPGTRIADLPRIDLTASEPAITNRTGSAKGTVIGGERAIADTKRSLGMLVTSKEAQLAPVKDAPALEVVTERQPRSREKQPSDRVREDTVEGVAVEAIRRHGAELEKAGGFRKGASAKAQEAIVQAARSAAKAPTVEEAEKQVHDAAIKALEGKVNKPDAETFAKAVAADVRQAPTFYSKAKVDMSLGERRAAKEATEKAKADAAGLIGDHGWKTVDEAQFWMNDDRSHGDEALASAAREVYRARSGTKRGRSDYGRSKDVAGYVEAVVRRAAEIQLQMDTDPEQFSQSAQDAATDFHDAVMTQRGQEAIERFQFLYGEDPDMKFDLFSGRNYAGYYRALQNMKDVVGLSLSARDLPSVADHEAFHAIEMRKLDGRERLILSRAFQPGKPLFEKVLEAARRYDSENQTNITDEILSQPAESRAYGFQLWRSGALEVDGAVKTIFAKIQEFLQRVANYFKGQGFQSAEDIFRAIDRGAYAMRAKAEGGHVVRFAENNPALAPDLRTFLTQAQSKFPDVMLDVREYRRGDLVLANIRNNGTKKGEGQKAIQALVDFADLNGRAIGLTAVPEKDGPPLAKLVEIYKRFGFTEEGMYQPLPDMGRNMFREPKGVADESSTTQVDQAPANGRGAGTVPGGERPRLVEGEEPAGGDTQFSRAATVPRGPFQQQALQDLERRFKAGELEQEQFVQQVARVFDPENLSDATAKDLFGATKEKFAGGMGDFWLKNLASPNYISRFSAGYKNLQRVLTAFTQRKSALFAQAVNGNLSQWISGAGEADLKAVSDALMERTVGGYQKGDARYQEVYGRLNDKQRKMFDQANAMIGDMLQREFVAEQADYANLLPPAEYEQWREQRATRVAKLISDGYVPERRYGDHTVHLYLPMTNAKGETERVTLRYEQFENRAEAAIAAAEYLAEVRKQNSNIQVDVGVRHAADRDTQLSLRQFLNLARRHGIPLEQNEKERIARALIAADSTRMNRIFRRKNVPGFSTNGLRILTEFALTTSSKIAHSEYSDAIEDALVGRPVETAIVGDQAQVGVDRTRNLWDEDGPRAGFYRNLADELTDYVLSPPQRGAWAQKLRAATTLYFLGGSLSFGMINMSSLPMNTVPWLSQHVPYTEAAASTFASLRMVGKNQAVLRDLSKLQDRTVAIPDIDAIPGLRDAMIQAAQDGTTLDTQIHHLMGLTRGEEFTSSRKVQKALDVWMAPFRVSEQINRITTFTSGYKIGRDKGLTGQALYKFAQEAVHNTQFRYDEVNRPSLMHDPFWALLFTFKSFPLYMLETLSILGQSNKKALAVMLTSLVMAAGINGLPFAEDLMDIVDVIAQRFFKSPFQMKRAIRNIAKDASEALVGVDLSGVLLNGVVNEFTGLNVASRVGMGNLIPGTRLGAADQDYSRTLEEILGPVGGLLAGAGAAAGALTKGQFYEALKQGGPLALRNLAKGAEQAQTGEAVDREGRKLVDVGGFEAFWQSLGFSSAALSKAYEMDRMDKATAAFYSMVRDDFTSAFVKAMRAGDSEKAAELIDAMTAWNEQHPEMPIRYSASSIRRRLIDAGLPLNERTLRNLPRALRGTSIAAEQ